MSFDVLENNSALMQKFIWSKKLDLPQDEKVLICKYVKICNGVKMFSKFYHKIFNK